MNQEAPTPSKLELRLLGTARIAVDGALVEERVWTRRKSKALLKILALAPRHQMHREQLIESLWPEMEPELAVNNLHKAIHAARRALEPQLKSGADSHFILTHDQQVSLRAPGELWIDVEAFERSAEAALKSDNPAGYEATLALYEGELLSEDRYEDWAVAKREQMSLLAQRLVARLGGLYESAGQWPQSIEQFRRLLTFDQANEEAHRHLMRLYALAGNRHQALLQYQQCREALRKELDAEPEAATVKLHDQIIAGKIQSRTAQEATDAGLVAATERSIAAPSADKKQTRTNRFALIAAAIFVILTAAVTVFYLRAERDQPIDSIAVLPFAISGADANLEYLSDGVTESIINSLSQLSGLRVMARTTVFRYKGREVDPLAVGRDLKVRAVLTGKVQQRGGALVIQADLVDVNDGAQLWGAQRNFHVADLVVVQSQMASEISEKLRARLTNEERRRVAKRPTENVEAFQAYTKGRYHWSRRRVADLERAIEYFNQAIALDPAFALAYAGLADCYTTASNLYLPPIEAVPRARQAATKALELDDQIAGAHSSLAIGKWRFDWDWAGAEQGFRRAIELDANYAPAHQGYGLLMTYQKRFDAGKAELRQAQQLDPLSLVITANAGLPLYFSRQHDEAIAQFQRALELDQNFPLAHFFIGWAYEQKQDYRTALAKFQQAVELDGTPSAWAYLGHGHAVAGNRREAEQVVEKLLSLSKQRYVSPYYLAVVYAGLGENEQALDWLDKAVADHSDPLVLLDVEPKFDPLRSSPRFVEIARRVGFNR
jgi:DNA-binding SARP family transcriptional activator/TolB-like protein/Tfp pilus assembly protein PilF